MKILLLASLFIILTIAALMITKKQADTEQPVWLQEYIEKKATGPGENPPASIHECNYKGRKVYFTPAECCDAFSYLYDMGGNKICSPDGGFGGTGDGRCPDFFSLAYESCDLLWEDSRYKY